MGSSVARLGSDWQTCEISCVFLKLLPRIATSSSSSDMSNADEQAAMAATATADSEAVTPAADARLNVNNSAASGTEVIDVKNAIETTGEEEESDEGEGNTDQEQVVFAQNPSDLLTEDETSMLETIFNEMDTEKDGILRPKQLADALKRVGVQTDEETLRRQLMMGEGENEGIDQSDFIQLMAIHMKRMLTANDVKLAFSSFDLNNDGYIDKEELAHAMSHIGFHMEPEEIDEMIRDADKDGDGKISFAEFREKMVLCDGPGCGNGQAPGETAEGETDAADAAEKEPAAAE